MKVGIAADQFRGALFVFKSDADLRLGTRLWTTPWLRAWWHELQAVAVISTLKNRTAHAGLVQGGGGVRRGVRRPLDSRMISPRGQAWLFW